MESPKSGDERQGCAKVADAPGWRGPGSQLWGFARVELEEGLGTFWRAAWRSTLAITTILYVFFLVLILGSPSPSPAEPFLTGWVLQPAILFALALAHGLPPGVFLGLLALFRRWCGVWGMIALFLIPTMVGLSVWWCQDWLHRQAVGVSATLAESMARHGWRNSEAVLDQMRTPVHALPIAIIFLGLLVPYVLKDGLIILTDAQVLLSMAYFLLCCLGVILLGLIPGVLGTGGILSVTFLARLRARFREFANRGPSE